MPIAPPEAGPTTPAAEGAVPPASPRPALTPPSPDPPVVTVKEAPPAPPENLNEAQAAASGLSIVAQSLAHTPPPANMGRYGKAVVVFLVFALSGLALYLVVRELKGANAREESRPYVIDAARIQPGAPNLTTGDPYWDSLLGYRGRRP